MKRVDPFLRGNIPEEARAVDERFAGDLVVFAPAYPDRAVTTSGGRQLLHGDPLGVSFPDAESRLPVLLSRAFPGEETRHITLAETRSESLSLASKGCRVFSFDAVTNADLRAIVAHVLDTASRVLWIGTAALADALLTVRGTVPPVLGVAASLNPVTAEQLLYAEKQGAILVRVYLDEALDDESVMNIYSEAAAESLAAGRDTILVSASALDVGAYARAEAAATRHGMSQAEMSEWVTGFMGRLGAYVYARAGGSGVFLGGSHTAVGFFRAAGSTGASIVTEVAMGMPMTRISGGPLDGVKAIAKAGGFGRKGTIYFALRKLREADLPPN
jgi:uncharacterized protein YgbK (DUF1537 family)